MKANCEQCGSDLAKGYVEAADPLTEEVKTVCFSCAAENAQLRKALEEDDLRQHAF